MCKLLHRLSARRTNCLRAEFAVLCGVALYTVMHIAAAMISPDLRIQAANQSMGAVIGCDCSELQEQPFLACFHPEDAAHASRTMRHLQQQHFSHRQQLAAQAQLAAHAAAIQAAAAQAIDGLNTPPAPLPQHQVPPLQTWEVLTLRISRRVSLCHPTQAIRSSN